MDIILLFISLALILAAAHIFTNAVEWLGQKLNLNQGSVGSILAAVGTALPESMIPVIAILFGGGSHAKEEIGVGAILGAPFMLGTLALFISGITVILLKNRRHDYPVMRVDVKVMGRDQKFFILVYTVAILTAFIPEKSLRLIVAAGLVLAYFAYVWFTITGGEEREEEEEKLAPLIINKKAEEPGLGPVLLQLGGGLFILIMGAHMFVDKVEVLAHAIGIPAFILSLIIAPVATELPEKFNSVIWYIKGKDTLALGNITGAMVFQSSLLPALGIALTQWNLTPSALISAGLALLAIIMVYTQIRIKGYLTPHILLVGGVFYLVFLILVITGVIH